jgi:ZIP family zinc transporter
MSDILFYAIITGLSLVIGAAIGLNFKFKQSIIASIMAYGAGMLICTLTFGLMEEAFSLGGFDAVIIGFLIGGLVFIGGDYLLHYFGARKHRRIQLFKPIKETNGKLIVLGASLDNIPEAIALGIAFAGGQSIGILLVVALIISQIAESISSIPGLIKEKFKHLDIYLMWSIVAVITIFVALFSYHYLGNLDSNTLGIFEAFAAGAILAMLSDSMMPEAFEEGGFGIALLTLLGFLTAFILTRV